MQKALFPLLLLATGAASAAQPYVPPPAPPTEKGDPISVQREIHGNSQIIHLARESLPWSGGWTSGKYKVYLACDGAHPLRASLSTTNFSYTRETGAELVFLTLAQGQDKDCSLIVEDPSTYPWKQVFEGKLSDIPPLSE